MRTASLSALLFFAAPLAGCGGLGYHKPVTVEHPRVELDSGIEFEDELTGVGPEAQPGDELVLDYSAWFADGSPFDSSHDRGMPVECRLGEAPLAGWNEGIRGMRAGGKRRMWLPPALAYGAEGVPGIVPPEATLEFLLELIEIRPPPGPPEPPPPE